MWLYALLIGSVVDDIGGTIGNSGKIRDIVNRMGGSDALEDSFITIAFSFLAVAAAAMAIFVDTAALPGGEHAAG